MGDSCCICGLVLAPSESDFPQWYEDICALCWFEDRPILSTKGYVDDDAMPFNLLLPGHGLNRFCYRRSHLDELEGSCYPFHAACLILLQENDRGKILAHNVQILFNIFESIHYHKATRALRWGHNYYFQDILDSCLDEGDHEYFREGTVSASRAKLTDVENPLHFNVDLPWNHQHFEPSVSPSKFSDATINSIPPEVLESIMCGLDCRDVLNLLLASATLYKQYAHNLPPSFWESRFWPHGEAAFALSIRPSSYSWKDWFFRIKSELREGPNKMNLRNRKRIWKLAVDLINLLRVIKDPDRVLYGDNAPSIPYQMRGYVASCLAQKHDSEGCRELMQRCVHLSNRTRLRAIRPSYVALSNRRLVSGFSFEFSDGGSVDVGYVVARQGEHVDSTISPKILWLISSQLGFEAIAVDTYPQQFLDNFISNHGTKVAIARWTLENIEMVCLGLDAIRIVRVYMGVQKQDNLDGILWTPPRPSSVPCIHEDDIAALYKMQSELFAPASIHCVDPKKGSLVMIKVYSALGRSAGIAGIGFVYDTGTESMWGSADDAASLAFFLDRAERLVRITVYKINSLVCHLQFTTSHHRTSKLFPPLSSNPNVSLKCVEYEASNGGHIIGFCGCLRNPFNQLHCFGVIPTATAVSSTPTLESYTSNASFGSCPPEMPLGGIRNHGQYQSRILLRKRYQSVQASINPAISKYRRAGQVTGLLFRSSDDPSHPDLLGQWTGTGTTYDLDEGEQIVDLQVTAAEPLCKQRARSGLSQVEGITVVTNRRRISWSQGRTVVCGREPAEVDECKNNVTEARWEFNAIFDRVLCSYQ